MGRPAYQATDEGRKIVKSMTGKGATVDQISKILGISADSIQKHYRAELDTGAIEANQNVAGALYSAAMAGNVGAQCFWLKCRGRWKEDPIEERAEQPIKIIIESGERPARLQPESIKAVK